MLLSRPVVGDRVFRAAIRRRAGAGKNDLVDAEDVEVRVVHPFQARKDYVCPGCQQTVAAGTGHVVVVPRGAADLRRHWHRSCWDQRHRRRPGR